MTDYSHAARSVNNAETAKSNLKEVTDRVMAEQAEHAARKDRYLADCQNATEAGQPAPCREDYDLWPEVVEDDPPSRPDTGVLARYAEEDAPSRPDLSRPRASVIPDPAPPPMPGVRHISAVGPITRPPWCEFHSDKWLAGTAGLTAMETAALSWISASLMNKGRVTRKEYGLRWRAEAQAMEIALEGLIALEKVRVEDGLLRQERAETVYHSAVLRLQNHRKAANARWDKARGRARGSRQ